MPGSTNFKVFNPNLTNMADDATYDASSYRLNGAVAGLAPSNIHNKLYYQQTTMVAALAQMLANHGFTVNDDNFANLVATLEPLVLHLWQPDKAYAVGDICYSATASSYKRMECIVGGVSGAVEPVWPAIGQTVADGAVTWSVKDVRMNDKAPLASPQLTGTPTAPTAAAGTNNTQIATTAFVQAAIVAPNDYVVAQSLGVNGYTKWASGKIEQWGLKEAAVASPATITFPIAFPSACFAITTGYNNSANDRMLKAYTITPTSFILAVTDDGGSNKSEAASWFAVGK